jgi:CHAD domain-containing protein
MADGKWIHDLTPVMPLEEAARRVLNLRLEVVRDHLPLVQQQAERDPEHVHQLRVGTRRADAALRIFVDCLPAKVYKAARRRLRRIRRAAGEARDWDVFLMQLLARQTEQPAADQPGLDFLIGYAVGQRRTAQGELEEVAAKNEGAFEDFQTHTVETLRSAHSDTHTILADLACPLLSGLLHDLETAAAGDLKDYALLHRVRIVGKRLRYAMEVLACCFPAPFRDTFYPMIEDMQEILGRANDSHVAGERLTALREQVRQDWPDAWSRFQPGVGNLLRFHQRRLPQDRQRFLKWWDRWREAGVEEIIGGVGSRQG